MSKLTNKKYKTSCRIAYVSYVHWSTLEHNTLNTGSVTFYFSTAMLKTSSIESGRN